MNAYEGMFVIDLSEVKKDTNEVEEIVEGLIKKCGGELAALARWDERKLAYDIKGRDSGLYTLTYFHGGQETVKHLNHECRLSSVVLRALFLRLKEIPDIDAVIHRKNDRAARDDRFDDGPPHRRSEGFRDGRARDDAPAAAAPSTDDSAPPDGVSKDSVSKDSDSKDSVTVDDKAPVEVSTPAEEAVKPTPTSDAVEPAEADVSPAESPEDGESPPDGGEGPPDGGEGPPDGDDSSPDGDDSEEKPRVDE